MYMLTFFCIKTTFARIDFLRQGVRLMSGKGTHNVKFLTENQTKQVRHIQAYDNGTERMYDYDRQREQYKKWGSLAKHFKKKYGVYLFFTTFVVTKTYIS